MKSRKFLLIAILAIASIVGVTSLQDAVFNENESVEVTEISSEAKSVPVEIVDVSSEGRTISVGISDGVGSTSRN